MLYREYSEKMRHYAEIRDRILKYKVLIICVLCLILAAWTGFLITKGTILQDVSGDTSAVYGDALGFKAKALFTRVGFEYAEGGNESWSEEIPIMPGEYRVRAVAKRAFGLKNYGEPLDFTISKREATVGAVSTVEWLEAPRPTAHGLASGDSISYADVRLDSTNVGVTTAHVSESSVRIVNEWGDDVTSAYLLTVTDTDVSITPRKLTVKANDTKKIYDGMSIPSAGYKVTGGSLADSHTISTNYTFSESVSVGTHSIMLSGLRIYDGSADVTANYRVTLQEGKATITPRKVKVIAESASKVYDGTPLNASFGCLPVSGSGIDTPFASGESPRFTQFSITDVIRDGKTVKSAQISTDMRVYNGGRDVTRNYDIQYDCGKLTVTPRTLSVRADNYSKKYDGLAVSPVEGQSYHVTGGLLSGHSTVADIDADCVNATDTPRKYTLKVYVVDYAYGQDKTSNYDVNVSYANGQYGTITISHRQITVSTGSQSWEYDGTAHSWEQVSVGGEELAPNEFYMIGSPAYIENVGSTPNNIKIRIYNKISGDSDTTDNYKISYTGVGTLSVYARAITVTSATASKTYDATPLYSAVATSDRIVKGHSIRVDTYSSMTDVLRDGRRNVCSIDNVVTVRIFDGSEDVSSNYVISYKYGRLTVNPRKLSFMANSAEKTYDRTPLTDSGYTIGGDGYAVSTHSIAGEFFKVRGSRTAVGSSVNRMIPMSDYVIMESGTRDVTHNYMVTLSDGTLIVLPRLNSFEPDYMGKEYDGTPLTATDAMHVGGQGMLKGDSVILVAASGSHTLVGEGNSYVRAVVIKDEYGYTVAMGDAKGIITVYHVNFADSSRPMYIPIPDEKSTYVRIDTNGQAGIVTEYGVNGNYTSGYVNRDGETVTDSYYDFEFLFGVINIRARRVTISTGSAEQPYTEGATLSESSWRISQGSMVVGHYLTAGTTGVADTKGVPVKNTIDLKNIIISDEYGNDITEEVRGCYIFTAEEGILLLS